MLLTFCIAIAYIERITYIVILLIDNGLDGLRKIELIFKDKGVRSNAGRIRQFSINFLMSCASRV